MQIERDLLLRMLDDIKQQGPAVSNADIVRALADERPAVRNVAEALARLRGIQVVEDGARKET